MTLLRSSVLLSSWKRTVIGFFLALSLSSSGDRIEARFLGRSSSLSRLLSDVEDACIDDEDAAAAAATTAAAVRTIVLFKKKPVSTNQL